MSSPEKILFSDIEGVLVGNAQDDRAKTGVTVFRFPCPATAAVTILGGGPSSRETELANPDRNCMGLNALIFAGGSSFGLEASHGVMQCLEEQGIGYETGAARIPLVCQSDIYDLSYGDSSVRPDRKMGYDACLDSLSGSHPVSGNAGAGTGATVGKPKGILQAQKGGIGYSAAKIGDVKVGVAIVLNSYGDVFSAGKKIAGMMAPGRKGFYDASEALFEMQPSNLFTGNTSLAAVFTNGDFSGSDLKKISNMASAGMARCICPVFTMADGDTVYALSVGSRKVASDVNVVGTLAARLVEEAVKDAIASASISEEEFLSNARD